MQWAFPSPEQDPWDDGFVDMVNAMDQSAYASVEDRHAIIHEGGSITWAAGAGTLAWSAPIGITAPVTGFRWQVSAGNVTLTDGQVMYVTLNRGPLANTALVALSAGTAPQSNDTFVIAARVGSVIYLRNGNCIADGEVLTTVCGGGVPSGGTKPVARIVVGNSVNGDTVADVTYLDAGDGVQLAAAIAAAGSGSDVWVRPGTYDFRSGALAAGIAIPAGVRVRGAGKDHVTIIGNDRDDMSLFVMSGAGSQLTDMTLRVPLPLATGTVSDSVVSFTTNNHEVSGVRITFDPGYTVVEAGLLSLRSGMSVSDSVLRVKLTNVEMLNVPQIRQFIASDFCGVHVKGGGSGLLANAVMRGAARIDSPVIEGGDYGVLLENRAVVTAPEIFGSYVAGLATQDEAFRSQVNGGSVVVTTAPAAFVGVRLGNPHGCIVNGVTVEDTSGPAAAASIGVALIGTGSRHSIGGCTVTGFDAGVDLGASTADSAIVGNSYGDNTVPLNDQSGGANEVAHNA
jgi:hypothetical protein